MLRAGGVHKKKPGATTGQLTEVSLCLRVGGGPGPQHLLGTAPHGSSRAVLPPLSLGKGAQIPLADNLPYSLYYLLFKQ